MRKRNTSSGHISLARGSRILLFFLLAASLLLGLPVGERSGTGPEVTAVVEAAGQRGSGTLSNAVALQRQAADLNLEAAGALADAILAGPEGWVPAEAATPAGDPFPSGGADLPAAAGRSPAEDGASGVTPELPAPSGLTVTRYGQDYLIQWEPVGDPRVTGYDVYRSYFSNPRMGRGRKLNREPLTAASYFDTSVDDRERQQYYSVCGVDDLNRPGPGSPGVAVQPWLPDADPPAPVAAVDAGFVEEGLSAAWTAANREPDFDGYNLYLSDTPGQMGKRLNAGPVRDTFFFAEGISAGAGPRFLAVRAVDTTGNESDPVQVEPGSGPFRCYDDDSPELVYGGFWKREAYIEAHGGALMVANDAGAYTELTFTGRSIKVYSAKYWTCGVTEIYLDGYLVARVDQYADATRYGALTYKNYALRPGTHVIRIVATGTSASPEQVPGYHFTNWDYLQVHQ